MDFVRRVEKTIEKERLIKDGDNVLLGLSGGIDSTALLYVLTEISKENLFKIGVAHVNHLLRRDESDRDQDFVERLAHQFSLPCHIKRFDVYGYAKEKGISLQHAGRDIRYEFFDEIAVQNGYDKIAIAHNLDDQIETFVLRMLKGTGLKGLASIPVKRNRVIRPLLYFYRSEIEDYVKANGISYVEDSSNSKTAYERNYIRKEIIPRMKTLNPAFKEKIYLLLQDIAKVNHIFDEEARKFEDEFSIHDGHDISFDVDKLCILDSETRFRVIARALGRIKPDFIVLREHYHLVDKILVGERPNLSVNLPHGIRVMRVYGRLVFTRADSKQVIEGIFPVAPGENVLRPFGLTLGITRVQDGDVPDSADIKAMTQEGDIVLLDADKTGDMYVRTFRAGDRFIPLGMNNSVKLKDFFISRKVPKEQRRQIPLLMSNDAILWVIGHRIDERYKITGQTKNILRVVVKRN